MSAKLGSQGEADRTPERQANKRPKCGLAFGIIQRGVEV